MATVSAHLPEGSELEARFFAHIKQHYRGKPGPFIREIIERTLESGVTPDSLSPSIIVDLTRELLGRIEAREMEELVAGGDQPRMLRDILRSYLETTKTLREPEVTKSASEIADEIARKNLEAVSKVTDGKRAAKV